MALLRKHPLVRIISHVLQVIQLENNFKSSILILRNVSIDYSILVKLYLRWTIQVSEVTSHVCSRLVNQIEITVNEKTLETGRGFFLGGEG